MKGSNEIFDKSVKYEDEYHVKVPSNIFHYVYVPGFRPDHVYLYAIIVDKYNVKEGYAYPTQDQLAILYGKTTQSVRRDIRKLIDVGLVRKVEFTSRANNGYVPLKPLSQTELFEQCPEAEKAYREAHGKITAERQRNREKLVGIRNKK
jgi:hypothetical protein